MKRFPSRVPALVRLLASPVDAECLNAARALGRVLALDGFDLNDIAAALEQAAPSVKTDCAAPPSYSATGSWHARYEARNASSDYDRANWLARYGRLLLSEREHEFVAGLAKQLGRFGGRATPRQAAWLDDLWARVTKVAA